MRLQLSLYYLKCFLQLDPAVSLWFLLLVAEVYWQSGCWENQVSPGLIVFFVLPAQKHYLQVCWWWQHEAVRWPGSSLCSSGSQHLGCHPVCTSTPTGLHTQIHKMKHWHIAVLCWLYWLHKLCLWNEILRIQRFPKPRFCGLRKPSVLWPEQTTKLNNKEYQVFLGFKGFCLLRTADLLKNGQNITLNIQEFTC